jgi:hypothetical protein
MRNKNGNKAETTTAMVPVEGSDYEIVTNQEGKETSLLQQPVSIDENQFLSYLDLLDAIGQLSPKVSLNAMYREFNTPGEVVRAIYTGMSTISKKDDITKDLKKIDVCMWMEKMPETGVKQLFMNGGIALVDMLQTITPGVAIEITYIGKKDRTKLYNVTLLS